MENTILGPASVLVLWSLIMLFWMAATRFPAMAKTGMDLKAAPPGGRGQDLDAILPADVNWKSHNYAHLMEQPTIFYGVVAILALAGQGGGINTSLAWGYVILRIIHSLYQALINKVPVRFTIFTLSTLCLLGLAINAVRATVFGA
jgi:hypothetical protein